MSLSTEASRRLGFAVTGSKYADEIEAHLVGQGVGDIWYVDTVSGADTNEGKAWDNAFASMDKAVSTVADNDVIFVRGDVREEVEAVAGIQGVRIIGATGGNTRHDNGVRWREPASGATSGGALLLLRDQGWEVHNILFVPKSDATALQLKRREDATDPDASHAIIRNCKFIGAATATTIGIEDDGGCHHVLVENCEFFTLNSGIVNTSTTVANPLRWVVRGCIFMDNTEHIDMPFTESVVQGNIFDEATTNVETDGGAGGNFVIENFFEEDQADITNANGYAGHTTDIWRNYSENTAAQTVGVP